MSTVKTRKISTARARRIALAAQGFATPRPEGPVTMRHLSRMIDQIGLIQIDSVNVVTRAHLMPPFSRLGPYDPALMHRAASRKPRRLVEYWAHEASLIPPSTRKLLRWRMDRTAKEAWRPVRAAAERPELLAAVLRVVDEQGPVSASEVGKQFEENDRPEIRNWGWNWPPVKSALEYLFWSGQITAASRSSQFERLYDMPDRVLPEAVDIDSDPGPEMAMRELILISAKAHGFGTAKCLRDYFRLPAAEAARAIKTLAEQGELEEVQVEGFSQSCWLYPEARQPRSVTARALLAPFDPLVFERDRLETLFGFRYRIEIYTPAPKREYGYYVFPFLLSESMAARVDLKADRKEGALLVKGSFAEAGAPPETAAELAAELKLMAGWLGLDEVKVESNGDLAVDLWDAVT